MRISLSLLVGVFALHNPVLAADEPTASLVVDHQKFVPAQLSIPAASKTKVVIRNQDAMPIEFESYDLSREIVVPGHGEVTIYVGPLDAGSYRFFNDFDHDMQGAIIVKPAAGKGN
jgi:hypothetical protein